MSLSKKSFIERVSLLYHMTHGAVRWGPFFSGVGRIGRNVGVSKGDDGDDDVITANDS